MERYQKELSHIKDLLKRNTRGMTVTEIAKAININRNSVAKYLDILQISGQVDMKTVGPAKVYFLSHRVPISALLNFSSDSILVLDRDLKIVQTNENFLELMSVERDDLLEQSLEDSKLPLLTSSNILNAIKEARDGKDFTLELKFPRRDMDYYVRLKLLPTTFDDGASGVTMVLENITEQKQAEEQLRYQATLVDNVSEAIISTDVDFIIKSWNQAATTIYGWQAEEVLGKPIVEVLTTEYPDGQSTEAAIRQLEEQGYWNGEVIQNRKDGSLLNVLATVSLLKNSTGNTIGVVAINRDITARKQVEEAHAWEFDVNATMAELARALIQAKPVDDIAFLVLEAAKRLTDSAFGYVGYIDSQTGYLICPTLTKDIWEDCQVPDKGIIFKEFRGLWGWVLEHHRPLLTNNAATDPRATGTPPGHFPIRRFLSVPALINGALVGQVALANAKRDYTERDLSVLERLAALYALALQRMQTEAMLRQKTHSLGERIKELNCLYSISRLVEQHEALEEILQGIVELLPSAWQYPEVTCARMIVDETEFRTKNFQESRWKQSEDIVVYGRHVGSIEIFYLEDMSENGEDPFLKEEQALLNAVGERVGRIIERKRTAAALVESEEKYRLLFDNAPIGIGIVDEGGTVIAANQVMQKVSGYSMAELQTVKLHDLYVHPNDRENLLRLLHEYGMVQDWEVKLKRKDGTAYSVLFNVDMIELGTQRVLFTTVRDISKQKQAEEQLQYQAMLVDNVSDAVISTDVDFIIKSWNQAATTIYGWQAEEVLGKPIADILQTEYPDAGMHEFRRQLEERGYWNGEVIQTKKDGTRINIFSSVSLFKDRVGNPTGAAVINSDITPQKQAELAVRAERDKFQQYLDVMGVILVALDAEQNITLVNKKACEVLGYDKTEILGKNWLELFLPERSREKVRGIFEQLLTGAVKRVEFYESPVVTKSGEEKSIIWRHMALSDDIGKIIGTLSSGGEITERKQTESVP